MRFSQEFFKYLSAKADEGSRDEETFIKSLFLDWLGCAIAGLNSSSGKMIRSISKHSQSSSLGSTVWDDPFVLGYVSHCLELDDSEFFGETHPSAVIFSSLFHKSNNGITFGELFQAARVAYYSLVPLGIKMNPAHYGAGWHGTGTVGTIASAIASAYSRKLTEQQIPAVVGVSTTLMSGTQQSFGHQAKYLNSARASENGCLATAFVQAGMQGPDNVMDSSSLFWKLFSANKSANDDKSFVEAESLNFIKVKQYPVCHCLIPIIEHLKKIQTEEMGLVEKALKIQLSLSPYDFQVLIHKDPMTPEEAAFSSVYTVQRMLKNPQQGFVNFFAADVGFSAKTIDIEVRPDDGLKFMQHRLVFCVQGEVSRSFDFEFDRGFKKQDLGFVDEKFKTVVGHALKDLKSAETLLEYVSGVDSDLNVLSFKKQLRQLLPKDLG